MSLYVHFPWCVRKCPYCDFNSHALRGDIPEVAYIEALIRDLDWELSLSPDSRLLTSVFMGGGTPSLFSGKSIGRLLESVAKRLRFAPDIEITLEANPGTADAANFRGYRAAGVNRLSIGVQSLNERQLKALGRIHGPEEARRAVDLARAAGFENINLDLMYALPQQTLTEAERDIRAALALQSEHLSYYHLTLEPNTEFHAHPPPLPDADLAWAMQEQGERLLADHGYAQYEVSAYARAGRQCRHNRNYWEFGDYLGIGAGAHGKITRISSPLKNAPGLLPSPAGGRGAASTARREGASEGTGTVRAGGDWGEGINDRTISRRARHKHPRTYLETAGTAAALQEDKTLAAQELPFEFAMNALRLNQGLPLREFEARTGQPAALLAKPVAEARRRGLLDADELRLQTTASGRAFLNELLTLFLP